MTDVKFFLPLLFLTSLLNISSVSAETTGHGKIEEATQVASEAEHTALKAQNLVEACQFKELSNAGQQALLKGLEIESAQLVNAQAQVEKDIKALQEARRAHTISKVILVSVSVVGAYIYHRAATIYNPNYGSQRTSATLIALGLPASVAPIAFHTHQELKQAEDKLSASLPNLKEQLAFVQGDMKDLKACLEKPYWKKPEEF